MLGTGHVPGAVPRALHVVPRAVPPKLCELAALSEMGWHTRLRSLARTTEPCGFCTRPVTLTLSNHPTHTHASTHTRTQILPFPRIQRHFQNAFASLSPLHLGSVRPPLVCAGSSRSPSLQDYLRGARRGQSDWRDSQACVRLDRIHWGSRSGSSA